MLLPEKVLKEVLGTSSGRRLGNVFKEVLRMRSGKRLGDFFKKGRRDFHYRLIYNVFETNIKTFLRRLCDVIVSAGSEFVIFRYFKILYIRC